MVAPYVLSKPESLVLYSSIVNNLKNFSAPLSSPEKFMSAC
jgi:hypothetical protein